MAARYLPSLDEREISWLVSLSLLLNPLEQRLPQCGAPPALCLEAAGGTLPIANRCAISPQI
jgi:hypothetical protein